MNIFIWPFLILHILLQHWHTTFLALAGESITLHCDNRPSYTASWSVCETHRGHTGDSKTPGDGAPLSSVGSARNLCAEALQRTRVRVLAWDPLLCVTPPLLPCFLSRSSAVLSEKAKKGKNLQVTKKPPDLLPRRWAGNPERLI